MQNAMISFSDILWIFTFITAAFGVYKAFNEIRKPYNDLRKDVNAVKEEVAMNKEKLRQDYERLNEHDEGQRVMCYALLAMIDHDLHDSDKTKLEKAQQELNNYLIERKGK